MDITDKNCALNHVYWDFNYAYLDLINAYWVFNYAHLGINYSYWGINYSYCGLNYAYWGLNYSYWGLNYAYCGLVFSITTGISEISPFRSLRSKNNNFSKVLSKTISFLQPKNTSKPNNPSPFPPSSYSNNCSFFKSRQ